MNLTKEVSIKEEYKHNGETISFNTSPLSTPLAKAFLLTNFIELRRKLDPCRGWEDHVDTGQATVPGVALLHMFHHQHHLVLLRLRPSHPHHGTADDRKPPHLLNTQAGKELTRKSLLIFFS